MGKFSNYPPARRKREYKYCSHNNKFQMELFVLGNFGEKTTGITNNMNNHSGNLWNFIKEKMHYQRAKGPLEFDSNYKAQEYQKTQRR